MDDPYAIHKLAVPGQLSNSVVQDIKITADEDMKIKAFVENSALNWSQCDIFLFVGCETIFLLTNSLP